MQSGIVFACQLIVYLLLPRCDCVPNCQVGIIPDRPGTCEITQKVSACLTKSDLL